MRISLGKVQGETGVAGKGITACTITYASNTSGTSVPISGWSETIPAITQGQYLWTKTLLTFSDDTQTASYSVGYRGQDIKLRTSGSSLYITTGGPV